MVTDPPQNSVHYFVSYYPAALTKDIDKINLKIDLGFSQTVIGNINSTNWGIDCISNKENSCELLPISPYEEFIFTEQYKMSTAKIHLRPHSAFKFTKDF